MTPREEHEAVVAECVPTMTLSEAEAELRKSVYVAAQIVEHLEGVGSVRGNGHHIRQKIAEMAVELLRDRWQGAR